MAGRIYCGDNLEVLSLPEFFQPEMVDLVYADPPFNSQRTYNIVYKDSNAQDEAFKDFWTWTEAAPMYSRLMGDSTLLPRSLKPLLESLHSRLINEDDDLLAYLTMMTPRLVQIHRVLKRTGTMYLHCDPTASHYLKIVLDAIFGSKRFVSEIIWKRTNAHGDAKRWSSVADILLMYTKGDEFTWNPQRGVLDPKYIASKYRHQDKDGRRYMLDNMTSPQPRPNMMYSWKGHASPAMGWRYELETMERLDSEGRIWYPDSKKKRPRLKRYLDKKEHALLTNVWTDIAPLNSQAKERLGYPTQKPLDLLKRIILASSNHGDIVLDPFCGCGTTVEASERLGRRWWGIDIAHKAVDVINTRFVRVGLDEPEVIWQPADKDAAHALGEADKHSFERWALRKIRAARLRSKDRGIDGEALFKDGDISYPVIVSVKAGGVKPGDVRDLRGTIVREDETLLDDGRSIAVKRTIGVFVSRKEPSDEMRLEATRAGFLPTSDGEGPIPRIQFVNVERLFGPLPAIRCPGKNVTEMPKPTIPPPPVVGEQLGLDIDRKVRDAKLPAKSTKPGPAKTYERPSANIKSVADSSRPKKS
jgi:site-specific DNA-methyltransferase (adenine-specific)